MKALRLLIFFSIITIVAQAGDFRFGLHFDPTLSWMKPINVKELSSTSVKAGFNYGLLFDYDFADNYAFATAITISQTGGVVKYDNGGVILPESFPTDTFPNGSEIKYKIQNLEIPVGLKLKTNQIGYMTYFAQISGLARVNLRATGDVVAAGGAGKTEEKIKDDVRFINLGWEAGAGVEYALGGNTSFVGGLFFNNGITDAIKTQKATGLDGKVVGNYLALRIGIIF